MTRMTQRVRRKRHDRHALFITALFALPLVLSGCDDKKSDTDKKSAADSMAEMTAFMAKNMPKVPKDLLEAACKEGKVDVVYNNISNVPQYVAEFHKHFPCIDASGAANGDDDTLARFYAGDKQGAPPDVIQMGSEITMHTQLVQKGLMLNYVPTEADKFETMSPGYVYSVDHQSQGILYNTNSIKPGDLAPIKTWKDMTHLLDPAFKGKRLGMVDPHGAGGGSYVVAYILSKEIGTANVAKILDALHVTIYAGSGPAVDALASGELDLIIGNEYNAFTANGKGAPVQVWYPQPWAASYTGMGIAAKSRHPNAAKLYVEYAMTDYANGLIGTYFFMAPGRQGTADPRPATKLGWYNKTGPAYKFDVDDMLKSYNAVVAPYPAK